MGSRLTVALYLLGSPVLALMIRDLSVDDAYSAPMADLTGLDPARAIFLATSEHSRNALQVRDGTPTCMPTRKPCGTGANASCIPQLAVCCNSTGADYCYPGEICTPTATSILCSGRPKLENGCGNGYKSCGGSCIPMNYSCCNNTGLSCYPGEKCSSLYMSNANTSSSPAPCCLFNSCGSGCLNNGEVCCNDTACAGVCSGDTCIPPAFSPAFTISAGIFGAIGGIIVGLGILLVYIKWKNSRKEKNLVSSNTVRTQSSTHPLINARSSENPLRAPRSTHDPKLGTPVFYDFNEVPKDSSGIPILPLDYESGMYYEYIPHPDKDEIVPMSSPDSSLNLRKIIPSATSLSDDDQCIDDILERRATALRERKQSIIIKRRSKSIAEREGFEPNSTVLRPFSPLRSDEITLEMGDPVVVNAIYLDGWAEGLNLRSGTQGAFPVSFVLVHDDSMIQYCLH